MKSSAEVNAWCILISALVSQLIETADISWILVCFMNILKEVEKLPAILRACAKMRQIACKRPFVGLLPEFNFYIRDAAF